MPYRSREAQLEADLQKAKADLAEAHDSLAAAHHKQALPEYGYSRNDILIPALKTYCGLLAAGNVAQLMTTSDYSNLWALGVSLILLSVAAILILCPGD